MEFNENILRIFDVRAKPGKRDELLNKLSSTSVSVVKGKPGNLGYFFGETTESGASDFIFISIWSDLASIKSNFGAEWQSSHLPDGYGEIIESCAIRHTRFSGELYGA